MKRLRKKQLCSMTGITSATLRYYVEQGIVRPLREENGSYYSYSLGDAAMILLTRQMRGFGTPLEKVAEYVERGSKSREEYHDVMTEELHALQRQKEEIEKKIRFLSEITEARQRTRTEDPFLFHSPSDYYAAFYDGSENSLEAVTRLQNHMPYSLIAFRLKDQCDPDIGLMIAEEELTEAQKEPLQPYALRLGRERILVYRSYEDISDLCREDFAPVFDFCEQHSLHVASDLFCIPLRIYEKDGKTGCELLGGVTFDFG